MPKWENFLSTAIQWPRAPAAAKEEEEHVFPDFRESGVFLVCRSFLTHENVAHVAVFFRGIITRSPVCHMEKIGCHNWQLQTSGVAVGLL